MAASTQMGLVPHSALVLSLHTRCLPLCGHQSSKHFRGSRGGTLCSPTSLHGAAWRESSAGFQSLLPPKRCTLVAARWAEVFNTTLSQMLHRP